MPKSKQQYEEMRQKSRSAIIEAALDLFATSGYHATSIAMIARKAGVAIGLMYHYFPSKEDLLKDIMRAHLAEIQAFIQSALGCDAKKPDIRAVIDALFSAVEKSKSSWRLIISVMFQPNVAESAGSLVNALSDQQMKLYWAYFKSIGADNPEERARTLGAVIHGALISYAMTGDWDETRLVRENVIERLLQPG